MASSAAIPAMARVMSVMMKPGAPDAKTLAKAGVARISYGPGPYRAMIDWLGKQAAAVYGAA